MTFSRFILSRNLPGECSWLSMSKCLGTLRSWGALWCCTARDRGEILSRRQSLAERHLCNFWGCAGCCHSHQLGSCVSLSPASPSPWLCARPWAECPCLSPGTVSAGEISGSGCGNILQHPRRVSPGERFNCCLGLLDGD